MAANISINKSIHNLSCCPFSMAIWQCLLLIDSKIIYTNVQESSKSTMWTTFWRASYCCSKHCEVHVFVKSHNHIPGFSWLGLWLTEDHQNDLFPLAVVSVASSTECPHFHPNLLANFAQSHLLKGPLFHFWELKKLAFFVIFTSSLYDHCSHMTTFVSYLYLRHSLLLWPISFVLCSPDSSQNSLSSEHFHMCEQQQCKTYHVKKNVFKLLHFSVIL